MQYIQATFRRGDARSYTYANPGEPLAIGDAIKVPDKSGEGWKIVYVSEVGIEKPTKYECKSVIGKADPKPEQSDLLD